MSALFDFRSFCIVLLLAVCSCTYIKLKGAQPFCRIDLHFLSERVVPSSELLIAPSLLPLTLCSPKRHQPEDGVRGVCRGAVLSLFSASRSTRRATTFAASFLRPSSAPPRPRRFRGLFWKFARVGERLSPWVAVACFGMAISILVV